jgi:transposase InsO family protein
VQDAVQYAVKQGLIEGVELNSASTPEFCEACTKAKATHQPFPEETANRAHTYGELVHTDLWGPAQTESVAGHLYYISFTDDFSQETKVQFLKMKSKALSAFKDYETELKRQTPGAKIKKLRSDRGGEYLSTEFNRYLKDQGIKQQLTIHHSPQQNGVAERLNRTLVEHARAMLLGQDMPKILWVEALNYTTWLKNHLPS